MVMQLTFNHSNIGLNPIDPKFKIKNLKVGSLLRFIYMPLQWQHSAIPRCASVCGICACIAGTLRGLIVSSKSLISSKVDL